MDKQSLFMQVSNLEERIGELYGELGNLKQKIVDLLEENQRLILENQQLQAQLQGNPEGTSTSGRENLWRIYHEGFHICNVKYGSLRTEGECLFCLAFLQK
ncbi:DNA replication initiation control protein YabA [Alicyclobacillaceae bacterium I2511]|nr:DNA replication initiation control protein YabA [Alicyclobacillaceae bacterium I2511]